jgi:hypothetical protein
MCKPQDCPGRLLPVRMVLQTNRTEIHETAALDLRKIAELRHIDRNKKKKQEVSLLEKVENYDHENAVDDHSRNTPIGH